MVPGRDDTNEKTVVASDTTLKKELSKTDSSPPVLVVLIGPPGYQGKQWNLQDGFVIGRAIESNIFIDDKSLSRSHARIDIKGNNIYVLDLGSTNKTIVNGQVIPPMVLCELKNNDQVKTGNVIFKYLETGNIESISTQALFERATKDALTGANSKGALLEKGPEAVKRSEILNEPMSIIIFDIDFFKKINDTYGHPCGDFVLKELAKVVTTKLIRSNDFFARYGGEEFVLILSGTDQKIAAEVAERIRMTIQNHEFIFENKRIPVTISLGVTSKTSKDSEWNTLLERSDKALYTSKQTGRNKVTQV